MSFFNTPETLVFKNIITAKSFSDRINKSYSLDWARSEKHTIVFLDSFDGRLNNAGFSMIRSGSKIVLRSDKSQRNYVLDWPASKMPKWAEDFSDAGIAAQLSKLLDTRSLTTTLSLKIEARPFTILNEDKKTIARAHLLTIRNTYPQKQQIKTACIIKPLRGYSVVVKSLRKSFPSRMLYNDFNHAMIREYGIDLKDYSKPVYVLKDKENISQALYEILYKNFLIIRKNESGIVDDIDIEFLHDYRVACRRMRSSLSLIKNVLDPASLQMLKSDLKHIGRYSGPLRDLDVYLLREDEYKALLPADWPQKDIHAIFVRLKSQRKRAFNRMTKMLKSTEYQQLTERWQDFFDNYNDHIKSDAPLLKTASAMILKWFQRIIKDGRRLSSRDPDEKFHDLRIKCKKLRYLLEFFGPLYSQTLINKAVKQLKKLQENLGEFNDYSVQIDTLNKLLQQSVKKPTNFVKTVAGLITVLDYKMHQLKEEFYALFTAFSSEKNIILYNKIFGK